MTAVEFLQEKIKIYLPSIHQKGLEDAFKQAKQMELEQQQKIVDDALTNYELGWADRKASSQTEISDEEIVQKALEVGFTKTLFIDDAKWYREQLKTK